MAWDLIDLKGVVFVDETVATYPSYSPESRIISGHELATLFATPGAHD
jgi:hypothetical protein